VLVTKQSFIYC